MSFGNSVRAHPDRGWMTRQLEALDGGDFCPVDFQDRDILIEIVTDEEIFSVGRERRALRQAADFDIADLGDILTGDPQNRNAAIPLMEVRTFIVGARKNNGHGDVALRRDGQALRSVANDHAIDDAWRIGLEVNDAHSVNTAVRVASISVVRRQRDLATGRDCNIVWPLTGGQVELGVGNLVTIDIEQRNFVIVELGYKRALPVGGKHGLRYDATQINRVDHLDVRALD